jgi:hypothetical protein
MKQLATLGLFLVIGIGATAVSGCGCQSGGTGVCTSVPLKNSETILHHVSDHILSTVHSDSRREGHGQL